MGLNMNLPSSVGWRWGDDLLVRLLTAVYRSCKQTLDEENVLRAKQNLVPIQPLSCGYAVSKCSVCAMLNDQKSLDRLVYGYVQAERLKEWKDQERAPRPALYQMGGMGEAE